MGERGLNRGKSKFQRENCMSVFWNSGDEFFLVTEEGLKGEEQEPDIQKGGIVFGAL